MLVSLSFYEGSEPKQVAPFMARKHTKANWPGPPDLRRLKPEERANISVEMSSVMGEIVLDSIRDQHPGIGETHLLAEARKRIYAGRKHN